MSGSVLVPMDDSPPSKAALEHALSEHPEAEITVLYVVDTTTPVGYGDLFTLAAQTDHQADRSEELFDEAERIAEGYDVELTTLSERGVPARTIATLVEEREFDHVVMGSHRRTGINRLFLGSVAERVLRRTSVPLTVVP
jgi:nucleotide-binding universal stress UspA family protein